MSKSSPLPRPSTGELEILRVIWTHGPSTVREVWRVLNTARATGYTTVLKLMQIMMQKGLVRRDESQRAHRYEATITDEDTQRRYVRELLDRVFLGSAHRLMVRALETKRVGQEELEDIRTLLDNYERENRP